MKTYVKPTVIFLDLTAAESFAVVVVSGCDKYGMCPGGYRYAY